MIAVGDLATVTVASRQQSAAKSQRLFALSSAAFKPVSLAVLFLPPWAALGDNSFLGILSKRKYGRNAGNRYD